MEQSERNMCFIAKLLKDLFFKLSLFWSISFLGRIYEAEVAHKLYEINKIF